MNERETIVSGRSASARPGLLVVVGDLDRGGTEHHLLQVLPQLAARGFVVSVYTLTHRGALADDFEAAGISVREPPLAGAARALPALVRRAILAPVSLARLLWLMFRERPSIAHFFLPQAYLAGGLCALVCRVPVRVMSRRSLNNYQARHPRLARLEHWLHGYMHRLVGNSRVVVDQLAREPGVDASRIVLIHNGVEAGEGGAPRDRAQLRRELELPAEALVMIVVANLIPYKGHADLLDALAGVAGDLGPDWTLLVVGRDDGIGAGLRSRAERLGIAGHVRWMGTRSDVAALQRGADIGVLCSHEEGFSNAVLEGMAAGLPMVVTAVGGNAEAVLHEETGLVVPPADPAHLGQAIARLATAPALRSGFGDAARRRVLEKFSVDRCVAGYLALYGELLQGVGRRTVIP